MFNYNQSLSILEKNDIISSPILQSDSDGNPIVAWISNSGDSSKLKFTRFDGDEWVFNDYKYTINKTINMFNFIEFSNYIYFLYNYKDENTNNLKLEYCAYNKNTNSIEQVSVIDSGNINFANIFEYSNNIYITYIKNDVIECVDLFLASAFVNLSLFTLPDNYSDLQICSNKRDLIFVYYDESAFYYNIFNKTTESWCGVQILSSIVSSNFSVSICNNRNGDILSPVTNFKSFYINIAWLDDLELKSYLHIVDQNSTSSQYLVKESSFEFDYDIDIVSNISVYSPYIYISNSFDKNYIYRTDDITSGFSAVSYPGYKETKIINNIIFSVESDHVKYCLISDNISYGYTDLLYVPYRVNRNFIVSGPTKYIDNERLYEMDEIFDIIIDPFFIKPFILYRKLHTINLFDTTNKVLISRFSKVYTDSIIFSTFDNIMSNLYSLTKNKILIYNIASGEDIVISSINNEVLSNINILTIGDKNIYVVNNNNIYILDRYTFAYKNKIKMNNLDKIYSCFQVQNEDLLIKGVSRSISKIYRISSSGKILNSFNSYSSVDKDENYLYSKYSSSASRAIYSFLDTSRIISINAINNAYWDINLSGYTISGICVDDVTGQVFVSCNNLIGKYICELDFLTGDVVRFIPSREIGNLIIYNNVSRNLDAKYILENSLYNVLTSCESEFIVNNNFSESKVLSVNSKEEKNIEYSFINPNDNSVHSTSKNNKFDVWHFKNDGIYGGKVSINGSLEFDQYSIGDVYRSPVISWDIDLDKYVDVFLVSDGTSIYKYAFLYLKEEKYISLVDKIVIDDGINDLYINDSKIFVSSNGYLKLFSYEDLSLIREIYIYPDLKIYDYKFGDVWCASQSSGTIFRVDIDNFENKIEVLVNDPINKIVWSDYYNKFLISSSNIINFLDPDDNSLTKVYDVYDYKIETIGLYSNKISIILKTKNIIQNNLNSYESVDRLISSKKDKVVIYNIVSKKYDFEKEYEYNEKIISTKFNDSELNILSFKVDTSYVFTCDINSKNENLFLFKSIEEPVKLVKMNISDDVFLFLKNADIINYKNDSEVITLPPETDEEIFVYYVSNSFAIPKSLVKTQTGDSSSSSSSSSATGNLVEYIIKVMVGDSEGLNNKWDSGEIKTTKKQIIYNGGNNLEPGQQYYVSIKCKLENGLWSPTYSLKFVMPHFEFFNTSSSSSSSSANSLVNVNYTYSAVIDETLTVDDNSINAVIFNSNNEDSFNLISNNKNILCKNENEYLSIENGNFYYLYSSVGESAIFYNSLITLISINPIILIINTEQ